jgi:hypothetical protein
MKRGERYALVTLDVMQSDAYRWLPHFAWSVLLAMASRYTGRNNGALELTATDAERFGIKRDELYAGIGLCIKAKLVKRTVEARRRSGRGVPARYALTWRAIDQHDGFNLMQRSTPAHEWTTFEPPFNRADTVRAADRALGYRNGKAEAWSEFLPKSKRVSGTRQLKNTKSIRHPPAENSVFTRHPPAEESGTRRLIKIERLMRTQPHLPDTDIARISQEPLEVVQRVRESMR